MFDTPPSNYQPQGGKSESPDMGGESAAEKVCKALQVLIDATKQGGDNKGASRLQEAYDIVEEFKTESQNESPADEGDTETGSPEGADQDQNGTGPKPAGTIDTSLTLGPMSNLKNYLARKSVDTQNRPFVS